MVPWILHGMGPPKVLPRFAKYKRLKEVRRSKSLWSWLGKAGWWSLMDVDWLSKMVKHDCWWCSCSCSCWCCYWYWWWWWWWWWFVDCQTCSNMLKHGQTKNVVTGVDWFLSGRSHDTTTCHGNVLALGPLKGGLTVQWMERDTPSKNWMVYSISWKISTYEMDDDWGTPILGNHQIYIYIYIYISYIMYIYIYIMYILSLYYILYYI